MKISLLLYGLLCAIAAQAQTNTVVITTNLPKQITPRSLQTKPTDLAQVEKKIDELNARRAELSEKSEKLQQRAILEKAAKKPNPKTSQEIRDVNSASKKINDELAELRLKQFQLREKYKLPVSEKEKARARMSGQKIP